MTLVLEIQSMHSTPLMLAIFNPIIEPIAYVFVGKKHIYTFATALHVSSVGEPEDICQNFANGTLKITTRQTWQVHGVLKRDVR